MSREDNHDDLGFDLPPPAKPSGARIVVITAGVALVLAGAFAFGFLPRYRAKAELADALRSVLSPPSDRVRDRIWLLVVAGIVIVMLFSAIVD